MADLGGGQIFGRLLQEVVATGWGICDKVGIRHLILSWAGGDHGDRSPISVWAVTSVAPQSFFPQKSHKK